MFYLVVANARCNKYMWYPNTAREHGQETQSTRDRLQQRAATKARSHQTDARRLARSYLAAPAAAPPLLLRAAATAVGLVCCCCREYIVVVLLLLLLCAVCWNLLCVCTQHASCARVRQRAATKARSYQTDDRRLAPCRTIGGNALGLFGPGFRRGCVRRGAQRVNPAASRRAGPSSARNERKRLGEPVLLVFSFGITGRVRERTVRALILTNSNTY